MTKQEFDELYVLPCVAIHCMTEEDAIDFLKLAGSFGYCWTSGHPAQKVSYWNYNKSNTFYELRGPWEACINFGNITNVHCNQYLQIEYNKDITDKLYYI